MQSEFRTWKLDGATFHGIAVCKDRALEDWIVEKFPGLRPRINFFRRSPEGQVEPNFIHSDEMMGDWTAILYLNPDPPASDGTIFYRQDGVAEKFVQARFNRLVIFRADILHSRAIQENYGSGDGSRLIQVVFGGGML